MSCGGLVWLRVDTFEKKAGVQPLRATEMLQVLNLRVDAIDLQVDVLLERQRHGFVNRQPADRACS